MSGLCPLRFPPQCIIIIDSAESILSFLCCVKMKIWMVPAHRCVYGRWRELSVFVIRVERVDCVKNQKKGSENVRFFILGIFNIVWCPRFFDSFFLPLILIIPAINHSTFNLLICCALKFRAALAGSLAISSCCRSARSNTKKEPVPA